jgi:hypothetical protein
MRTRRRDTKWIYRKHRAAHAHYPRSFNVSATRCVEDRSLDYAHPRRMINDRANSIFGIASAWHPATGVLRPSFTIVWNAKRDRVSQEQRGAPKGKYPQAKPGALGFEPLKAAWRAADAARLLIPKVNTIIAQTSARLTGPSPARKPLASRLPRRQFQTCGTAQFHRARRTRPIGDSRC